MRINEIAGRNYWAEPTLKSVQDSVTALVPKDPNYVKTFNLIKNGKVMHVSKKYFVSSNSDFEPYTLADLKRKDLDPRVKEMVRGFKKGNTVPMILATITDGKFEVYDGGTRAGVAMALGIPIYAKVVTL